MNIRPNEYAPVRGSSSSTKHSLGIKLFEVLLSLGVITRPVTNYDLPNYLRISVGTEEENKYFLKVLPQALDLIHSNSNYV